MLNVVTHKTLSVKSCRHAVSVKYQRLPAVPATLMHHFWTVKQASAVKFQLTFAHHMMFYNLITSALFIYTAHDFIENTKT